MVGLEWGVDQLLYGALKGSRDALLPNQTTGVGVQCRVQQNTSATELSLEVLKDKSESSSSSGLAVLR